MINFRFHLISLIAVFLALGLGILVGSSVVDQVIVDQLHRDINGAKHDASQANAQASRLNDDLTKANDAIAKSAPWTVQRRLTGTHVALVVERGVDAGAVRSLLSLLKTAGADTPGVFWLTDSWRLDSNRDLTTLEQATGATGNNASVRASALRLLARRLSTPPTPGQPAAADTLTQLRNAGFVDFTDGDKNTLPSFPAKAARVLVLTGTDTHLGGSGALAAFTQSLVSLRAQTVVGDVYNEHRGQLPVPQRGAAMQPVRGDNTFSSTVSTVDDMELVQGQVAAILALQQIGATVGHYGYGSGVQGSMPALTS